MKKSKTIALSAIFAALGTVLLFFGSASGVLDISCAAIASLLIVLAIIEIGGIYPFLIYAVTSLLSALILPDKFGAVVYILIIGWYPIAKRMIEKNLNKAIGWIVKLVIFNTALVLIFLTARFVLSENEFNTTWLMIGGAAISNLAFVMFDIALTRLVTLYLFKYRQRFRRIFK